MLYIKLNNDNCVCIQTLHKLSFQKYEFGMYESFSCIVCNAKKKSIQFYCI